MNILFFIHDNDILLNVDNTKMLEFLTFLKQIILIGWIFN